MQETNGTRVVVIAFAILCGLTGIIAGIFEILQGDKNISGLVISTIGPKYQMADDFTYFAISIVPKYYLTGILAIIVSSGFIIWTVKSVDKKHGVKILFGLAVVQMLVGGGWVIDLALITCLLATLINKPSNRWVQPLPSKFQAWLVKFFPYSLVFYSSISVLMLALTILGVNDIAMIQTLELLAILMFVPILLMIFGGLVKNSQRRESLIDLV